MSDVCPTCGRRYPPKLLVGGFRRQRMVDYVAGHPEGVTVWQILEHVYADDPEGGPTVHNVVSVMAKHANDVLIAYGYKITATGGPGSRYFLRETRSSAWDEMWKKPLNIDPDYSPP